MQYGPAWRDRATNTYLIAPENAAVVYWPEVPGPLMVPEGFDVHEEKFFYLSDREHNPQRQTAWTDVYPDPASPDWIISVVTPVDNAAGEHIATIGHDLLLTDFIARSFNNVLSGAYNLIFDTTGQLIVHPEWSKQLLTQNHEFKIQAFEDAHLQRIFEQVTAEQVTARPPAPGQQHYVVENHSDAEFLAVAQLKGPDWYFVTVYPKALFAQEAIAAAKFVLLSGGLWLRL